MTLPLLVNFLIFAAVMGAGAAWSARLWHPVPALVIVHALLCLGIVFQLSWIAFWVHPVVGRILVPLVVVASAASLVWLGSWRSWRSWAPLTGLVASVALVHHGFAFLWGGAQHAYGSIALRYLCGAPPPDGSCGPMPPDNLLPAVLAQKLWDNQSSTLMLADWNGSDRPPLQSGAILIGPSIVDLFGVEQTNPVLQSPNFLWSLAASSLVQFLVVAAIVALAASFGLSTRAGVLTAIFISVLPLSVFNLVFTWPKMLSAAYGVAAVAVLVEAIRRRSRPLWPLVTAAALAALAAMAHGGAAFALPLFGGLGLALLLTTSEPRLPLLRGWVVPCLAAGGVALLVMAPWTAYGTWADPSHSRLPKWHLAGVSGVDHRPFFTVLREAYTSVPPRELLAVRIENLRALMDPVWGTYFEPRPPGWVIHWRNRDFFKPLPALGLGSLLAMAHLLITLARLRRTRRDGPAGPWLTATLIMWLCLLSTFVWGALMFLPYGAIVHTGSYIWLVLLAAVPYAFLVDRVRWGAAMAVLVLLAQTAYSATVYWSSAPHATITPTPPPPDVLANKMAAMIILGVLGIVACVVLAWRHRSSDKETVAPEPIAGVNASSYDATPVS